GLDAGGAEAFGFDGGRVVAGAYQETGGRFDETGGAADEYGGTGRRGPGRRLDDFGVDAADRNARGRGTGVEEGDFQGGLARPFGQFGGVKDIGGGGGRIDQPGGGGALADRVRAEQGPPRDDAAAAGHQQQGGHRAWGPDEPAADRAAQFQRVARFERLGQVWGDLAVVDALHGQLQAGAVRGGGDRVAALRGVAVLG